MSRRPKQELSTNYIELIKQEISNKFGRKITNLTDCKALEISVFQDTSNRISYKTFSRLYGLSKTKNKPNKTTLNILSQYVGFNNFDLFIQKQEKPDFEELNYFFIVQQTKTSINYNEIESLCLKFGDWTEIYPFLEKILIYSRTINDIAFLKQFYLLPNIFEFRLNKRKYAFDIAQIYGSIIYQLPVNIQKEIITHIVKQANARQFYIEFYVDLDHLNGIYGFAQDQYHKYSNSNQSYIFHYNLKIYQAFISNNNTAIAKYYNKLQLVDKDGLEFPILLGRNIASYIYLNHKHKLREKDIITKITLQLERFRGNELSQVLNSQLFLLYIFMALQQTNNIALLSKIFKNINHKFIEISDYLTDSSSNHLLIYYAHHLIFTNQLKLAKQIIDKIAVNKFPLFEKSTILIRYYSMLLNYYTKLEKTEKIKQIRTVLTKHNEIIINNLNLPQSTTSNNK